MINNSFLDQFKQLPNRLVATVHKDPDFDAIGSLLAFGELLEELGKKVTLYAPDLDMHQFKHLPNINKLSKSLATEYDVAFFLTALIFHEFINQLNLQATTMALI